MSKHTIPSTQLEFQFPGECPNPHGLCMCGCGGFAPIAVKTDTRHGHIRGYPVRFIKGHATRRPIADRFWPFVDKSNGPHACWLWTGTITRGGYGHFRVDGKLISAHRVSWELHYGEIPEGEGYHGSCILHSCDANYPPGDITNRRCVNPAHLWIGNHSVNMNDMVRKERSHSGQYGELSPLTKLTNAKVENIRSRVKMGEPQSRLAKEYEVGTSTIWRIVHHRTWTHIP